MTEVTITQSDLELIVVTIIVGFMCVCACIGMAAHQGSAS